MPTYVFKNNDTGEVFEKRMSMSAREDFLRDNPNLTQMPTLFANGGVCDTKLKKPDDGFREVMSRISENMTLGRQAKSNLKSF